MNRRARNEPCTVVIEVVVVLVVRDGDDSDMA